MKKGVVEREDKARSNRRNGGERNWKRPGRMGERVGRSAQLGRGFHNRISGKASGRWQQAKDAKLTEGEGRDKRKSSAKQCGDGGGKNAH
jgi:hypothetical protein